MRMKACMGIPVRRMQDAGGRQIALGRTQPARGLATILLRARRS
jgi:hypothetical protein